jgi:hypothetical protein
MGDKIRVEEPLGVSGPSGLRCHRRRDGGDGTALDDKGASFVDAPFDVAGGAEVSLDTP